GTSMSRVYEADFFSVGAWLLQYVIVDQRFMPIFAMLFGAGFLILSEGRENTPGFKTYIFRRMGVLLLIGIAHAYLIWPGDILINYAICGPLLLLFYRLSPTRLFGFAIAFKLLHLAILQWPIIYDATFHRLLFAWWLEIGDAPMTEAAAYAGSYSDLLRYNFWRNQFIQWTAMLDYRVWNALSFMLVGMALYKLNVLSGAVPNIIYRRTLIVSLIAGTPFLIYGIVGRIGADDSVGAYFGFQQDLPLTFFSHNVGTAVTSFAMLSVLLLWYNARPTSRVVSMLRSVGRMALSNYVMQSLIFFVIFAVLEWVPYDSLDPDERLVWAIFIWAFQIGFSVMWLRLFSMGPLESLWRRLAGAGPARIP
ncbi:MAG: DUF418 domain-containing protein, partial [Pseudomonadales bacterium]|nr:DUF418 domain-containing protein [Pseudomonadales bacterium]